MKKQLAFMLLFLGFNLAAQAAGSPCTVNTAKMKATLECINNNLNYLLGLPPNAEPVYKDDVLKVSAKVSRKASTSTTYSVNASLQFQNISDQKLRIIQSSDHGSPVNISDNTGVSCQLYLVGNSSNLRTGTSVNPDDYITLKAKKSVMLSFGPYYSCLGLFKGPTFDISVNLLRFDDATGAPVPFTVTLTGVDAPIVK